MSFTEADLPRPVSFESFDVYNILNDLNPPVGDFDPDGDYTHTYRFGFTIWKMPRVPQLGWFTLTRTRRNEEHFSLTVDHLMLDYVGGLHRIEAEMLCRNDAYASPIEWNLIHRVYDLEDKEVTEGRMRERGDVEGSRLHLVRNGRHTSHALNGPVMNSWALLEAVQRMPRETQRLDFSLLDDFTMLKHGHRLVRSREETVKRNEEEAPISGIQHIGAGIIPFEHWVGPDGRLWVSTSDQRLYLLDENAKDGIENMRRGRERDGRRFV